MRIWTQKSASIQKRTSPLKFDGFAEKSEKDTVSYLSTKARTAALAVEEDPDEEDPFEEVLYDPLQKLEREEIEARRGVLERVWSKSLLEKVGLRGGDGSGGGGILLSIAY